MCLTITNSELQTHELGKQLGQMLKQPTLVLLKGDLGTGKTVFSRGVARGLGVDCEIPITSPTYTLMNHYQARLDLYHFDLYRISDPDELIELGFDEYAHGAGIALIEWPEKLNNPETPGLWINLRRLDAERREVSFALQGEVNCELMASLQGLCDLNQQDRLSISGRDMN